MNFVIPKLATAKWLSILALAALLVVAIPLSTQNRPASAATETAHVDNAPTSSSLIERIDEQERVRIDEKRTETAGSRINTVPRHEGDEVMDSHSLNDQAGSSTPPKQTIQAAAANQLEINGEHGEPTPAVSGNSSLGSSASHPLPEDSAPQGLDLSGVFKFFDIGPDGARGFAAFGDFITIKDMIVRSMETAYTWQDDVPPGTVTLILLSPDGLFEANITNEQLMITSLDGAQTYIAFMETRDSTRFNEIIVGRRPHTQAQFPSLEALLNALEQDPSV